MNENGKRAWSFAILGVFSAVGITVVFRLLMSLPLGDKGPEWVGAIGTVLTLAGTIWIGSMEIFRRKRETLILAHLHAEAILLRAIHAEIVIRGLIRSLENVANTGDPGPSAFTGFNAKLETVDPWGADELIPLTPIPNQVAAKLMQVRSTLQIISKMFLLAAGSQEATPEQRVRTAITICTRLTKTNANLLESIETLRKFCGNAVRVDLQ